MKPKRRLSKFKPNKKLPVKNAKQLKESVKCLSSRIKKSDLKGENGQKTDIKIEESSLPPKSTQNDAFSALPPSIKLVESTITVVLTKCSLELIKGRNQIMDGNKHKNIISKMDKKIADYRPDITHQCLLMLQDSPLNKVGQLNVFLQTENRVLIKIDPHTRIPRTFERFCGLMVQLLMKFNVRAVETNKKLLSVISNPLEKHLPKDIVKITTSCHVESNPNELKNLFVEYNDRPLVFFIGAMSHGSLDVGEIDKEISFGRYPLSGALACAKLCTFVENLRGIF